VKVYAEQIEYSPRKNLPINNSIAEEHDPNENIISMKGSYLI
jgi:hypothetical protein